MTTTTNAIIEIPPVVLTEIRIYDSRADYICVVYVNLENEDERDDFYNMLRTKQWTIQFGISGILRPE